MKPAKAKSKSMSGQHRLDLGKTLSDPQNLKHIESARLEMASRAPDSPIPESITPNGQEIEDAASNLKENVEAIVSVTLIALDKIEIALTQIRSLAEVQKVTMNAQKRATIWLRALAVITALAMVSLIFAVSALFEVKSVTKRDLRQALTQLEQANKRLSETQLAVKTAEKKIEEVRSSAQKQSRVEIGESSSDDSTPVVRILPPMPEPDASSPKRPAPPQQAIEIPLEVKRAKRAPAGSPSR